MYITRGERFFYGPAFSLALDRVFMRRLTSGWTTLLTFTVAAGSSSFLLSM